MVELNAGAAGARLTKQPHAGAAGKLLNLCHGKVEEAQRYNAASVAQADQKTAPAPLDDVRRRDLTFDDRFLPRPQRCNSHNARPVLIAQRKMKQEVHDALNAQTFELQR